MEIQDLHKKIDRFQTIASGLEGCDAFRMAVEDLKADMKILDDNWQCINLDQPDKFYRMKYNKISNLAIINLIDSYKAEVEMLRNQVTQIEESES